MPPPASMCFLRAIDHGQLTAFYLHFEPTRKHHDSDCHQYPNTQSRPENVVSHRYQPHDKLNTITATRGVIRRLRQITATCVGASEQAPVAVATRSGCATGIQVKTSHTCATKKTRH